MRVSRRRLALIELGGGIATTALSLGALALLLFAPLIAYCSSPAHTAVQSACPTADIRYTSLLHSGADAGTWLFLLGMLLVALIGAMGAIGEARFGWRWGVGALWPGTVLAFAGCALGVRGIGAVYLPATLALCLAAYASLLRRRFLRASKADLPH